MEEILKELKSISEALNGSSDSLTSTISQINEEINKLNLGIEVWLWGSPLQQGKRSVVSSSHPTPNVSSLQSGALILGYARTSEGWGLAVQEVDLEEGFYEGDSDYPFTNVLEKGKPMPLLRTTRTVRYAAVRLIPLLLQSLKDKGNNLLKDITVAKELVKNIKNL